MEDLLTIVIPTHNRPALLARALGYYGTWGCKILVCDSSNNEPSPILFPNVQIEHTPELSFDRKLCQALQKVTTPYVCLSADDDFLAKNSVMIGIQYLEKHGDYISVQGQYVMFNWEVRQLNIYPNYLHSIEHHVDDAEPAQRIVHAMTPYMHHIYSLHRSSVLKRSFSITLNRNTPPLAEFTVALGGMIYGKHRRLPVFWMARDEGRYTAYNHSADDKNTTLLNIRDFLSQADGITYRARFAEAYSIQVGDPVGKGEDIFDQAFAAYFSNCSSAKAVGKIQNCVRKITPRILLLWRRKLLNYFRYSHLTGFPWGDRKAKKEWEIIKGYILRHGKIATIKDKRTY